MNQITLPFQIPENEFVRIQLMNNYEEYGRLSKEFRTTCRHSKCKTKIFLEIVILYVKLFCNILKGPREKAAEIKKKDIRSNSFNSSNITLLVLIAILLVLISGYIIWDCTRKNNEQKLLLTSPNDDKYDKVPTESDI